MNEPEVRQFLVGMHWAALKRKGLHPAVLPDDFDLMDEGITDSLGMLETVEALERRFGVAVNFQGVDSEATTRMGVLCRLVAEAASAAG
jgi:hypothetical protein